MSAGPRVLIVHAAYRIGGGEDAMVRSDAAALQAAGHTVRTHVVENRQGAGAVAQLAVSLWNPLQVRRLSQQIAEFSPDVVHVHNTWFALSPAVAVTAHRAVPTVMTLHNFRLTCANGLLFRDGRPCEDCIGGSAWQGVVHRCYRDSAAQSVLAAAQVAVHRGLSTWSSAVDRFIALTPFARDLFVRAGLPEDRVVLRANRVPDPGPRTVPASASDQFLFVGRLSPEKGVDRLLDVWAASGAAGRGRRLVVIGEGDVGTLDGRAVPGVEFRGRLDAAAVRAEMLRSRALLFASVWYENQPLVVLEAMAAGLPVLANDVGAVPLVLARHGSGRSAALDDPAGWAAQLALDDAALDALGRAGRAAFGSEYHADTAATSLVAVYEQAIAARSR